MSFVLLPYHCLQKRVWRQILAICGSSRISAYSSTLSTNIPKNSTSAMISTNCPAICCKPYSSCKRPHAGRNLAIQRAGLLRKILIESLVVGTFLFSDCYDPIIGNKDKEKKERKKHAPEGAPLQCPSVFLAIGFQAVGIHACTHVHLMVSGHNDIQAPAFPVNAVVSALRSYLILLPLDKRVEPVILWAMLACAGLDEQTSATRIELGTARVVALLSSSRPCLHRGLPGGLLNLQKDTCVSPC